MKNPIYFDNSATTKMLPEALSEYVRICDEVWGNPSSLHSMGAEAERVITNSKQTILGTLGVKDAEVIFTSSPLVQYSYLPEH